MSLLKNFIDDSQYKGLSFEELDIRNLITAEKNSIYIGGVLSQTDDSFRTSLEALPQDVLLTIQIPDGISLESIDDSTYREILTTSLEKEMSTIEKLTEKFKSVMNDLKHVFISHKKILDEVDAFDFKDLEVSKITSKFIDRELVSFVAGGNSDTESVLLAIMDDTNSELLSKHVDFLDFLYGSKYDKMTIDEAITKVPKEASKITGYEDNIKAILESKSLHRTPKHVKEFSEAMLKGDLQTVILNPYPRTAVVLSFGDHKVNSIYNNITGKKTLLKSSMLRIEDDSIKCNASKVSEKVFKAFIKYSRDEIKALNKVANDSVKVLGKNKLATSLTTKSDVIFAYREAMMNASIHIGRYSDTHCSILKALVRDAKIEGK